MKRFGHIERPCTRRAATSFSVFYASTAGTRFPTSFSVLARGALERSLALDPKNDRLRALLARPELRR